MQELEADIRDLIASEDSVFYAIFAVPEGQWESLPYSRVIKRRRYFDSVQKEPCFLALLSLNREELLHCLPRFQPLSAIISDRNHAYVCHGGVLEDISSYFSGRPDVLRKTFREVLRKPRQRRAAERLCAKSGKEEACLRVRIPCPRPGFRNFAYAKKGGPFALLYSLFAPPDGCAKEARPLVIYLHGSGATGCTARKSMFDAAPFLKVLQKREKEHPCFICVPQLPRERHWAEEKGEAIADLLAGLVGQLASQYQIDLKRVYLTGISAGGQGVWLQLHFHPELFAAAIPLMCGDANWDYATLKQAIPIWAGQSADDPVCPVEIHDKTVEQARRAGCEVRYTRWEKYGHKMSPRFYREEPWVDWLFAQHK